MNKNNNSKNNIINLIKRSSIKKKKKGFTLFTALISLLLISITLILIFNMVKTEETYLSLISDQGSISDLITITDLVRADAFNSFVVNLRSAWEEHHNNEDNSFSIGRKDIEKSWDDFTEDFITDYFFHSSFPQVFATSLINELEYSLEPTGYKIDVNVTQENSELEGIIRKTLLDTQNKVDIIDCNQNSDQNCLGTFYLNLDTRTLSDVNYEKLPRITVLKYKTNDVVQRPVLGRQVYKIYMPWRGFKAFRIARRIAYSKDTEKSENPFSQPLANDVGLFNPKIHNILEQARLGFCDPGTCKPRDDLFRTPDETGVDELCDNIAPVTLNPSAGYTVENTNIKTPSGSYNVYNNPTDVFDDLIDTVVEDNLINRNVDDVIFSDSLNPGFEMLGDPYGDINISKIEYSLGSPRTKKTIAETNNGNINPLSPSSLTPSNIFTNSSGGFGLFKSLDHNYGVLLNLFNSPYYSNNNPQIDTQFEQGRLKCYELVNIKLLLIFKESNPKFKVDDSINPRICVELVDRYQPFRFPNDQFQPGLYLDNTSGLIEGNLTLNPFFSQDKWNCYSCTGTSNNTCTSEDPS
jgi:hypothetical protein